MSTKPHCSVLIHSVNVDLAKHVIEVTAIIAKIVPVM
jgi:hypothetical protein